MGAIDSVVVDLVQSYRRLAAIVLIIYVCYA